MLENIERQPDLKIDIDVVSHFVAQQSDIASSRFVYSYTITIINNETTAYQLLSRYWVIQDANLKTEEVSGDGVIGEQPIIEPGESYSYTSGAVLETDFGTMEGKYYFIDARNQAFHKERIAVTIPKFLLSIPRIVH